MIKTLYVKNREDWRRWLRKNHDTEKEIWLIHYKKPTGRPCVSYDDLVEEALCFGWIDSIVKRIDDQVRSEAYSAQTQKQVVGT